MLKLTPVQLPGLTKVTSQRSLTYLVVIGLKVGFDAKESSVQAPPTCGAILINYNIDIYIDMYIDIFWTNLETCLTNLFDNSKFIEAVMTKHTN